MAVTLAKEWMDKMGKGKTVNPTLMVILIFFSTCSCSSQTSQNPSLPTRDFSGPVQPPDKTILSDTKKIVPSFGKLLKEIYVSEASFNPHRNEAVTIGYRLEKAANTTLKIYDPDRSLIKTLDSQKVLSPGRHRFVWNGKDLDGIRVPNEAYIFTLSAKDENFATETYDPTEFSGGVEKNITLATIDPQTLDIHYVMPEPGRVQIRMGIQGGPLLNQLVNWQPRVKGAVTEYWDGKDGDHLVNIIESRQFKMIITYFTLPENSIIVYGGKKLSYRQYKQKVGTHRPIKKSVLPYRTDLSPHYTLLRSMDYPPKITVKLLNTKGRDSKGLPILNDKTVVNVDLAKEDRLAFQNSQFEICFYLNQQFYAEDESGYTPFNWVWNLDDVPAGEHLLTVNISSFKDQIGVVSRRVRVVK